ncbi:P1 family peptidase [Amycolatopsis kentuckyensis]|uniref:P1 family peptidase n=1 Tax=Amycolatopsis kentuckyensis TaxID=218823 RepID=UPI0035641C92
MITDVPGVLVGHHERVGDGWATGTTVVLVPDGAVGAVDQRGGAPGTRETNLLEPENLVQRVNAVCLSGGSAYGLAAADGVMKWLAERNLGFPVGAKPHEVVPIVPAAVLFDLPRSEWGNRPDASFGYAACDAASSGPVAQGTVGAGAGAAVGSLKGGIGSASEVVGEFTVGAIAALNAAGQAVDPATGRAYAADHGDFGVTWPSRAVDLPSMKSDLNTTIGVVAVDAALSKAEARRLAVAAQDGLARAVRPAHTMFDGDTVFALATGARELPEPRPPALDALCSAAARVFARAMVHGLLAATTAGGVPAYRDVWPEAFA